MDMEVEMDFSEPLVDLSYMGIEGLELEEEIDPVRALVLSGNPISDYSFVEKFTELMLLHCDNVHLKDISEFCVVLCMPKLEVLVFRGNDLELVDTLPDLPELEHLDLSCNPFLNIKPLNLPQLEKFYFGVPSPLPEYETEKTCYSRSKINSLKAFEELFLSRYDEEDIFYARPNRALLGNIVFRLDSENKRVYCKIQKTDAEAKVANSEVTVTLFGVLEGVEVIETKREVFKLSELSKMTNPLAAIRAFGSPEYFYPTEHHNESLLEQELAMLRAVQLKRGKNYCIVLVEYEGKAGVFLMTREFEFLHFIEERDEIERIVSVVNGVSVRITKGGGRKEAFEYKNLEKESQPDFLPMARHGLEVELEPEGDDEEEYEEDDEGSQPVNNLYTPAALRNVISGADEIGDSIPYAEDIGSLKNSRNRGPAPVSRGQPMYEEVPQYEQPQPPEYEEFQEPPQYEELPPQEYQEPIYEPPVEEEVFQPYGQEMPESFREAIPADDLETISNVETESVSSVKVKGNGHYSSPAAQNIEGAAREITEESQFGNANIEFDGDLSVGSRINVAPPHHIEEIIYYKTSLNRDALLSTLEEVLREEQLFREYMDLEKILSVSIEEFNMEPYSVTDESGECFLVLNISLDEGERVPFKMDLTKLKVTNPTQPLELTRDHEDSYLIAQVKYANRYTTYISPKIVEYIPQVVEISVDEKKDGVIAQVIEEVPGKKSQPCFYPNIKFVFYRNQEPILETFDPILPLDHYKMFADGFYHCVGYVCDGYENVLYEVPSNEIYIKNKK